MDTAQERNIVVVEGGVSGITVARGPPSRKEGGSIDAVRRERPRELHHEFHMSALSPSHLWYASSIRSQLSSLAYALRLCKRRWRSDELVYFIVKCPVGPQIHTSSP